METTEKIVKSCCRYGKGWSAISHTKCLGQYEIDLLAVQAHPDEGPKSCHIENGISISGAYSMKCFSFWKDVKGAEVNGYSRFLLNLNRIDSLTMVGISFLSLTPLISAIFMISRVKSLCNITDDIGGGINIFCH